MQIILLQDVQNLGLANDLVTVKNGYARNYLIPKGMAVTAGISQMKQHAERIKQDERRQDKLLSQLQQVVDQLKSVNIKVGAKVGTTDKIFGSVTTHHLAQEIKEQTGANIDRRKIKIDEEIKTLGTYTAHINLHTDVDVDIEFEVISE